MANKLEDFRLESYTERMVIMQAIAYYFDRVSDMPEYAKAIKDLEARLSAIQCMEGGCEYCTDNPEDYDWRYE